MRIVLVLGLLTLTGCVSSEQRMAAQAAKDDQKCLSFGAKPGSDVYVNCRSQLSAAKVTADAIEDGSGPTVCNRVGNSTICN